MRKVGTMVDTAADKIGPCKIERKQGQEAQEGVEGHTGSGTAQIASGEANSPSRCDAGPRVIELFLGAASLLDAAKYWQPVEGGTKIYGPAVATLLRKGADMAALPDVAAMAVKLADVEKEREEFRATGFVLEDNLDELRGEFDGLKAERDQIADALAQSEKERDEAVAQLKPRDTTVEQRREWYDVMKADPAKYLRDGTWDTPYREYPYYTGDAISIVLRELEELRAKVAALSEPRVFNVAGMVENDLAERYESLRQTHWDMRRNRDADRALLATAGEEILSITKTADRLSDSLAAANRKLADMTTERDSLREICARKDKRIAELAAWCDDWKDRTDRAAQQADTAQAATAEAIAIAQRLEVERDAAAENARNHLASLEMLRSAIDHAVAPDPDRKPRCRVVTSPRFYSDADREAAAREFHNEQLGARDYDFDASDALTVTNREWCFEVVDTVAAALGMRRTGA